MKVRHYILVAAIAFIWLYKMLIAPVMIYPQRGADGHGGEAFADYGASAQTALIYTLIALTLWFIFYVVLPKVLKK